MPASHAEIYLHLVWATWNRLPFIKESIRSQVYACIVKKCENLQCQVVEIGGVEDHVHLLVRIPSTLDVSRLANEVKRSSSHLITHVLAPEIGFKWQGAYSVFSVSTYHVSKVAAYISNQERHHAENTIIDRFERRGSDSVMPPD